MPVLALSSFLSSNAGRIIRDFSQNTSWGLFYTGGNLDIQRNTQTVFGRTVKSFIKHFTPNEDTVFPEASMENVTISEDFSVSTAPKADGSYLSIDKAKNPQTWEVALLCDGHISSLSSPKGLMPDAAGLSALENRQDFLKKLRELSASGKYIRLRIPEGDYLVTLKGYKIIRDTASIECMRAILSLQEINQSSADPKDFLQSPKNLGKISAQKEDLPL